MRCYGLDDSSEAMGISVDDPWYSVLADAPGVKAFFFRHAFEIVMSHV
jgi:hypothetical protein